MGPKNGLQEEFEGVALDEYQEARYALDHVNVFQLIVAVALSAQTTDVSVNKVTPALFRDISG